MDVDGTNARQVTNLPAASENPIWSPDGSQIVFQSDRDGNFEIYVMDADGSNQRRLTENSAGDYWPSWGPSPGETAATEDLDDVLFFTHVCGFLISSGGKRILIDSLFRVDDPPTPTERVLAMRQGLPPFNDIDLILVTHDHHDHFDANLVGDNMLNNPNAVLVSTDVVVNRLQNQFSEFEQIQDRVIGIHLEQGEREQMNVAGIDLEIFFLSHGVPTVPNFGYFFAIDDINFFHTGDMNPEHVTTADLQAYDLPERKIDIAFVSGFRLADERFSDRILEGIQPKVMVPMHFNFSKTYDKSVLREVEANFQNVILFYEEMTRQPIDPETVE
jgi:L-ascorbate metabolism protein UlaG (beta-lactamase superfamily)